MGKTGVIFDMDGVIIDSEPLQRMAFDKVMEQFGIVLSEEEFLALVGKRSIENFANLVKQYNLSASADELEKQKTFHYNKILKENLKPIDYIIDVIEFLYSKDIPMALVSGSIKNDVEIILNGLNLKKYFKFVLSGEDVKHGKPHPEGFLKAAENIGITPSVSYVVEDSGPGVLSSHNGGFITLAVPTYFTKNQDFSKADFIFSSTLELFNFFKEKFK